MWATSNSYTSWDTFSNSSLFLLNIDFASELCFFLQWQNPRYRQLRCLPPVDSQSEPPPSLQSLLFSHWEQYDQYVHCNLADIIVTQMDIFQRLVGSIKSLETGIHELIVAQVNVWHGNGNRRSACQAIELPDKSTRSSFKKAWPKLLGKTLWALWNHQGDSKTHTILV